MRTLLQNIPILAGLSESALALFLERAQTTTVAAKTLVVREGEVSSRFYVIQDGSVRVCKCAGQADEVELARLNTGEFFGEMCILEPLPRAASVEAVVETRLVSLASLDFYQLYKALPDQYAVLLLNIARDLSRRLRRIDEVFAARH